MQLHKSTYKTALIIGASGDIGHACVDTLTSSGFFVIPHYYQSQNMPNMLQADITNAAEVRHLIKNVMDKYHQIDSLIITTGTGIEPSDWVNITSAVFNDTLNINLTGVFNCIQTVAPIMIQQSFGSIVTISSTASLGGSANCIAYGAAKAGLVNITKAFAKELAPHNINVNTISPAWTNTKWHRHKPISFQQMIKTTIPMGRMIEPSEVAETVNFLVNPTNRMITGQNIIIDGGLNL